MSLSWQERQDAEMVVPASHHRSTKEIGCSGSEARGKEATSHTDVQQRAIHHHLHGMPRALPPCHLSEEDRGEKLRMGIHPAPAWSCAIAGSCFTRKRKE